VIKEKMKTKTKVLAIVEIAIVLCSVFLVAIPAIAAEQNQEMQKTSASVITTASASTLLEDTLDDLYGNYILDIYGNANEDDTIDMGDVVYTKLAIFGKKPKAELCDAKYDGRINVLDVIQTKLIILGKEKELTIIDSADRIVTVKKPLKKLVVSPNQLEVSRSLKVPKDMMVGIIAKTPLQVAFFPEFSEVPFVGWSPPDLEAIVNLNPDAVITSGDRWSTSNPWKDELTSYGIPVIGFRFHFPRIYAEEVKTLGYILDKENEAEEYIDFYNKVMIPILEEIKMISEEDKQKVYYEVVYGPWRTCSHYSFLDLTGGVDIFPEAAYGKCLTVDPEAVIDRNPDIIVKEARWGMGGYHMDAEDITELKKVRDEIMSRPELQNVKAVKDGRVYIITPNVLADFPRHSIEPFIQIAYQAKWFHPVLFGDLHPKAIHQEYLTRFQGLDIDLDKQGVFAYPEPS
jgi:iron complex transport system substrate-binding protein